MIYFDNSATTRHKPLGVIKAQLKETVKSSNPGRGGYSDAIRSAMKIIDCREILLGEIGEGDIVFTKNCTEALNLAIFGSNLRAQVITTAHEHNSVLRPLYRLRDEKKIELLVLKPEADGKISPKKLVEALRKETSMVVLGETGNVLGVTQDIETLGSLAQRAGARVLIDAAQSMGHTDRTYSFADMIAASGHKGLHGPQGTGFLYVKKGIKLSPLIYGGTGTASTSVQQPEELPDGLESGTVNTAGIAALYEGAKWTFSHKKKIHERISKINRAITDELKNIDGVKLYTDEYSGIVLFNIGKMPSSEVSNLLDSKYGIAVRSGLHCAPLIHAHLGTLAQGAVRVSAGWNNKPSHAEALCAAVKDIAKNSGGK